MGQGYCQIENINWSRGKLMAIQLSTGNVRALDAEDIYRRTKLILDKPQHDYLPIQPDYDLVETKPRDWFPFILGVLIFVCAISTPLLLEWWLG